MISLQVGGREQIILTFIKLQGDFVQILQIEPPFFDKFIIYDRCLFVFRCI